MHGSQLTIHRSTAIVIAVDTFDGGDSYRLHYRRSADQRLSRSDRAYVVACDVSLLDQDMSVQSLF
jgi:hypothetical protein